jgi:hypothetical protein
MEDVYKDYSKKSQNFATVKEIDQIYQELEQKANIKDVSEALSLKASKESVINALHKKANKAEVDSMLNTKTDMIDFQEIIKIINSKAEMGEMGKLFAMIDSKVERADFISLSGIVSTKADSKDIEMIEKDMIDFKKENQKRIEDIDQDLDRLIENIKKEFQNLNGLITNLDVKKAEFKDFEKINNQLAKKLDSETLTISLKEFKNDFYDNFGHYKNDFHQTRKAFEEHINDKLLTLDKSIEKVNDDLNRYKEKLNDVNERRKIDQEDVLKQTKLLLSTYGKDSINDASIVRTEIQKMKCEIDDLYEIKLDRKEFDMNRTKIFCDIDKKVNLTYIG